MQRRQSLGPPAPRSVFKLLLLFTHLLGTSLALGAIVATDIRLLRRLADDRVRIAPPNPFVMRLITIALLLLYATGAAMVALGVADNPDYLGNRKLQGKLVLIALLTINAWVLHRYTFPGLARGRRVARWKIADFMRVAVPVSLSNCLWMYCAFLGIARPWNQSASFGFVLGTGAWLFAATLAAVMTVLVIAAQDRTDAEPGWIDVLKRQFGALATALRA